MKRLACCVLTLSLLASLGLCLPTAVRAAEAAAPAQASGESAHSATASAPPAAEESGSAPAEQEQPATGKPSLGLDRLLQPRFELPDQPAKSPTRDCNAWAARFDESRGEIKELELQIQATREKVAAKSGGAYQYSPLGGGETTSDPEVTKLRAQLKRDRESLEAAEKRLRELFVEADLAGIPRSCTEPRS
jgi:hypothetical protein